MKAQITLSIRYLKYGLAIVLCSLFSVGSYATIEIGNISCICDGDGKIELLIAPDPGFELAEPFEFEWSGPDGYTSDVQDPDDIETPGLYTVKVTNAYGCQTELSTEVTTCISISPITPICICEYGGAEYEVTGGSGDYTYFWEL